MTCLETSDHLPVFLDGEASRDLHEAIEEHLETCADCREEAERLRSVSAFFRSHPPLEPSATWELSLDRKLASMKRRRLTEEIELLRRAVDEMGARMRGMEEAEARRSAERDLMNVDEVAAYLRMPADTVLQMLNDLPHIELNYEVRFRRSSIDHWLEAHETTTSREGFRWSDWISGTQPFYSS